MNLGSACSLPGLFLNAPSYTQCEPSVLSLRFSTPWSLGRLVLLFPKITYQHWGGECVHSSLSIQEVKCQAFVNLCIQREVIIPISSYIQHSGQFQDLFTILDPLAGASVSFLKLWSLLSWSNSSQGYQCISFVNHSTRYSEEKLWSFPAGLCKAEALKWKHQRK